MTTQQSSDCPLVSVIIPNWNGRALLEQFMPSVVAMDYPHYEVIIVDNASADDGVSFLEKNYPTVRVIRHTRNDGTAEGSNIGAQKATGKYLFFISNDMWLDPAVLSQMVPHLERDPRVGICTLKMLRITASGERLMELDSVGAIHDVFGFLYPRGTNERDEGQWDFTAEIGFSFGGAMFIRRELYEKLGGYDSAFFTLTDDIDLSWRVRLLGFKVMVEPKAFLYHRVSATLNTPAFKRAHRRFLSERNTIRMLLKNYQWFNLLWVLPADGMLLFAEMCFFLCMGQWTLAWAGPRSVWWNLQQWRTTWQLRRQIQAMRTVGDCEIWRVGWNRVGKIWMLWDAWKRCDDPGWRAFFGRK